MISAEQLKLYGQRWGATCAVNDWRSVSGCLACDPVESAARSDIHGELWRLAQARAGEGRAVCLEDLRKATTALAAGRWASTKALSNPEFSRLLCLIGTGPRRDGRELRGLLIDPDDLASMNAWLHPEQDERARLVWAIEHGFAAGYVMTLTQDKFDRADWRALSLVELRQLHVTLKNRPRARIVDADPF